MSKGYTKNFYQYCKLLLLQSYLGVRNDRKDNSFILSECVVTEFLKVERHSLQRWNKILIEKNLISYVLNSNSGSTIYIFDGNLFRPMKVSKYKEMVFDKNKASKYMIVNNQEMNQFLIDTCNIDILKHPFRNDGLYLEFCQFLKSKEKPKTAKEIKELNDNIERHKEFINLNKENDFKLGYHSKYLSEGSKRLYSEICNTANPDHPTNQNNIWSSYNARYKLLDRYLNYSVRGQYEEHDVNASIYRLTYNLFNHEQFDQTKDFYKEFFKFTFNKDLPDRYRDDFKQLLMQIYMSDHTTVYRAKKLYNMQRMFDSGKHSFESFTITDQELYERYYKLSTYTNLKLYDFTVKLSESLHKFLNCEKFPGKDIFLFESDLHIVMTDLFLQNDIKTLNCYDCFYFKKDVINENQFFEVYSKSINALRRRFPIIDKKIS